MDDRQKVEIVKTQLLGRRKKKTTSGEKEGSLGLIMHGSKVEKERIK